MTSLARQGSQKEFRERIQLQDHKCVCQICSCGKHHCPPTHIEFKAETSNQHFYKPYNVSAQRTKKRGYSVNQSHYNPQLLKSTYTSDFKALQIQPTKYQTKYAYQPNQNKFYGQTQYNKSYMPHEIPVEYRTNQDHFQKTTDKFDARTTYGDDFKEKHVQQPIYQKHYDYQQYEIPFYGNTTYNDNFKKYEILAERPKTCEGTYQKSGARFEGKSTYQRDFKGLQGLRGCQCLVEQLPPRPRQCSLGQQHIHFCAHDCKWE